MLLQYLYARSMSLFSGLLQLIDDLTTLVRTGVDIGGAATNLRIVSIVYSQFPLSIQIFYEFIFVLCVFISAFLLGLVVHKGKTQLFRRCVSTSGKAIFILGIIGLVTWILWIVDCNIFDTWYRLRPEYFYQEQEITGHGLFLGVIYRIIWVVIGSLLKKQGYGLPDESDDDTNVDPEKKYICTACGQFNSGWYQTCPHCMVVGTMKKATPQIVSQISNTKTSATKSSSTEQKNTGTVNSCRKCGAQLQLGYDYCLRCGAAIAKLPVTPPVIRSSDKEEKKAAARPQTNNMQSSELDQQFICSKCGTITSSWHAICPNCESEGRMKRYYPQKASPTPHPATIEVKSSPEEQKPSTNKLTGLEKSHSTIRSVQNDDNQSKPVETSSHNRETVLADTNSEPPIILPVAESKEMVDKTPNRSPCSISLQDKGLSPKLRRAFLFAEDGEWERADEYLEKVLDEEPENAYAYLGKLLVELRVESIEQLSKSAEAALCSRNYKKALRYSDDELRGFLESLGSQMNEFGGESATTKSETL